MGGVGERGAENGKAKLCSFEKGELSGGTAMREFRKGKKFEKRQRESFSLNLDGRVILCGEKEKSQREAVSSLFLLCLVRKNCCIKGITPPPPPQGGGWGALRGRQRFAQRGSKGVH